MVVDSQSDVKQTIQIASRSEIGRNTPSTIIRIKKRDLSPTIDVEPTGSYHKKLKSSETKIIPESKHETVELSPGNDERGPSNSDQQLERSNDEIFALLRGTKAEICDLRKEIQELRNRLSSNSRNETIYMTNVVKNAANLEHNDSDYCQDVEMEQPRQTITREPKKRQRC